MIKKIDDRRERIEKFKSIKRALLCNKIRPVLFIQRDFRLFFSREKSLVIPNKNFC